MSWLKRCLGVVAPRTQGTYLFMPAGHCSARLEYAGERTWPTRDLRGTATAVFSMGSDEQRRGNDRASSNEGELTRKRLGVSVATRVWRSPLSKNLEDDPWVWLVPCARRIPSIDDARPGVLRYLRLPCVS